MILPSSIDNKSTQTDWLWCKEFLFVSFHVFLNLKLSRGLASQRTHFLNERDHRADIVNWLHAIQTTNDLRANNWNVNFQSICHKFWTSSLIGPKTFKLYAHALTNPHRVTGAFRIRWSGTHHLIPIYMTWYMPQRRTTYWPAGMIPMGIFRGTGWKSCDVESNMASRWALITRPFNTSWNIPSPPTDTTLGTQTASFSIF